jgi:hypothetical protein
VSLAIGVTPGAPAPCKRQFLDEQPIRQDQKAATPPLSSRTIAGAADNSQKLDRQPSRPKANTPFAGRRG